MLKERILIGEEMVQNEFGLGFVQEMPNFDDLINSNATINLRADNEKDIYNIEILSSNIKFNLSESPKLLKMTRIDFFKLYYSLKQTKAL